jgi:hypothetical protein
VTLLIAVVVLGAAGFAAASIASGQSSVSADTTGTTATATAAAPQTVTVTNTATVTRTVRAAQRVQTTLLCHRMRSGRFVTIRVRVSVALLQAHLVGHKELAGRCTPAKIRLIKLRIANRR